MKFSFYHLTAFKKWQKIINKEAFQSSTSQNTKKCIKQKNVSQ